MNRVTYASISDGTLGSARVRRLYLVTDMVQKMNVVSIVERAREPRLVDPPAGAGGRLAQPAVLDGRRTVGGWNMEELRNCGDELLEALYHAYWAARCGSDDPSYIPRNDVPPELCETLWQAMRALRFRHRLIGG